RLPLFWVPPDDGLWPHLTVRQHLLAVLPDELEATARADELLAAFDLQDKSESYPDQLSQGESGRLALARALASDAKVLVLDEPLVHVAPADSRKYWEALRPYLDQS